MLQNLKSTFMVGVLALLLIAVPSYIYYFYVYPMADIQSSLLYLGASVVGLVVVASWGAKRAATGKL
jgi:hypothetical protein